MRRPAALADAGGPTAALADAGEPAAALADAGEPAAALADAGRRAAALADALFDACLGETPPPHEPLELRAWLAARGVKGDDIEAVVAAPQGLFVHRALVRNGLSAPVASALPLTRARMNARASGRFDRDFARFVAERGPRSPRLRDLPFELVAWAQARWRADCPAYFVDLVHVELARFVITAECPDEDAACDHAIALNRGIAFSRSMRRLTLEYPVHALAADDPDPPARPVTLIGYRDGDGEACFVELSPDAGALVDALAAGQTVAQATAAMQAREDAAFPAAMPGPRTHTIAQLLADLAARGVVLGARTTG